MTTYIDAYVAHTGQKTEDWLSCDLYIVKQTTMTNGMSENQTEIEKRTGCPVTYT